MPYSILRKSGLIAGPSRGTKRLGNVPGAEVMSGAQGELRGKLMIEAEKITWIQ